MRSVEWHAEARRRRNAGMSTAEIGKAMDRDEKTVRNVVALSFVPPVQPGWWHADACAMHRKGQSAKDIAAHFKKSANTVRQVLSDKGFDLTITVTKRNVSPLLRKLDAPRPMRTIRQIINRDAVMGAAKDFAAGVITCAELMDRISA